MSSHSLRVNEQGFTSGPLTRRRASLATEQPVGLTVERHDQLRVIPLHVPSKSEIAKDEIVLNKKVGDQAIAMNASGTVWNVVANGDLARLQAMVKKDPGLIWARGPAGETPIHLCCLLRKHELVYWMLKSYPEVAMAQYTQDEYDGENCLHIAIVNQDQALCRHLAHTFPMLLHQRAVGKFFKFNQLLTGSGTDQLTPCYYGEYPLHFAAATDQSELFDMILEVDCSTLQRQDSNGNTVLHLCVIHDFPEMYDHICAACSEVRIDGELLWDVDNVAGMSPLVLAADLGSRKMFEHILERSRQVQWSYGPVTCILYPLKNFDLQPGRREGALEKIVNREHIQMLVSPRVRDLLSKKWETFGARIFWRKFQQGLVFLLLFLVSTVFRKSVWHYSTSLQHATDNEALYNLFSAGLWRAGAGDLDALKTCVLVGLDIVLLAMASVKLWRETTELLQEGLAGYFCVRGAAFLENICSSLFCIGIFSIAVIRMTGVATDLESMVLSVTSLIGWGYLLFFLLGDRKTGPIVVMVKSMLLQDVMVFCLIFSVFLLGFAQAFYVQFGEAGFNQFIYRIKSCFVTMLGDIDLDPYYDAEKVADPYLSIVLITGYIVVISVMLLNLLIAMMGDTYSRIIDDAKMIWQLEQARILFSIETEMNPEEREKELAGYWLEIDGEKYVQVFKVDDKHYLK